MKNIQKNIQNKLPLITLVLLFSILTTSCSVIEGIFKTGFGIGIFVTLAVIGLIIYLIAKFLKK